MSTTLKIGLAALLATGLLSGCGKNSQLTAPDGSSASSQDQAEVTEQLASNPDFVDDGVFEASDPTAAETSTDGSASLEADPPSIGTTDGMRPIRFWRHIVNVRRSFEFAFADTDSTGRPTTAVVTVHKALTGSFNVEYASVLDSVFAREVVRKPLNDHWVRRILLKRVRVADLARRQWRIVGLSGVRVTSRPAATQIVSLRLQTGDLDTTVTDPLAFIRMRNVLRFDLDDSVTVTVTTQRNDDVVVVQHRNRHMRFHNNGDNTYTGVFRAGFLLGMRHVGVNALANGTIYRKDAPYDSQAWILPYVLRPTMLADYEP